MFSCKQSKTIKSPLKVSSCFYITIQIKIKNDEEKPIELKNNKWKNF
jgi:hypothetical protein